MIKNITLTNDDLNDFKYDLEETLDDKSFDVKIRTDLSESYESLISNPTDLNENIEVIMTTTKDFPEFYDLQKEELMKKIKESPVEYLSSAKNVIFDFDPQDVSSFIEKNPILKEKNIIFSNDKSINYSLVVKIKKYLKDTSNVYVKIPDNEDYVSFDIYCNTVKTIKDMIDEIKKFDLSPLEQIIYAYDLVKERVYTEVDDNENKSISRDLSSSLLGDKIVCSGYAKIFKTILLGLNIPCNMDVLVCPDEKVDKAHARNEIYLKDEKYDINGVYYFDPTWDSKSNENDNSFLFSYSYFAKTKHDIQNIDRGELKSTKFPYFSKNMVLETQELIEENGITKLPKEYIKSINYMSFLINKESILSNMYLLEFLNNPKVPTKEEVIDSLIDLMEYFDSPISIRSLLEALYVVRKKEQEKNPTKYRFDEKEAIKTVLISNWNFNDNPLERLFNAVYYDEDRTTYQVETTKKFYKELKEKYEKETKPKQRIRTK